MPLSVKARVYLIYVRSVVLHGLDCITWAKQLADNIKVFQNHVMRFITGHRLIDKVRISTLRQRTSLSPLFETIKSKTLKLYGHMKRSQVELFKLCFEGLIEGKRNRGRPKQRWCDNLPSWSNTQDWNTINRLTQDRSKWKKISHVSSQSTINGNSD